MSSESKLLEAQHDMRLSEYRRKAVDDNYLLRQMMVSIINNTPIEILTKIFDTLVIDPTSKETLYELTDPHILEKYQYEIIDLRMRDMVRFKCSFNYHVKKLIQR